MKLFRILFFSKWTFTKPRKANVLIYDEAGERFYRLFFSKKSYEILDTRYKNINIYIFLKTILKSGIKNFKDNYKKFFIKSVSPKIVFTAVDNNPAFYNLKNIYDKPYYISVQNGMRKNEFYQECKKYIKKTKTKLKADYIFTFGENEKKRLSGIIEGKIYCCGNLFNNHYLLKSKKVKKKISSIMYISQYSEKIHNDHNSANKYFFEEDKRIFNFLIRFCQKKNIKLRLCAKAGPLLESYYRNNLTKGNWIYFPKTNKRFKTYNNLNKQQMLVFSYSTLGFEGLAKGLRCASFNKQFPIAGSNVRYSKSGPFWSNSKSYYDVEKTLKRVIGFSNKHWKQIASKYSTEIINYDPANTKIKNILKNILKKT